VPSDAREPTTVTLRPAGRSGDSRRTTRAASTGAAASIWRFRSYLLPYRWRFVVMLVVSVLGIGASILVPLVTRRVVDGPIAQSDRPGLYALGAAAIAVGVGEALLMFIRRWIVSKATLGVETDIRVQLYAKLQHLPLAFHSRWESGQLLSRITSDLSTIRRFLGFGLVFLGVNILQIIVVVLILVHLYWPLGLVVVASTVPVTWVSLRSQKIYTKLSRAVQDQTGDVASSVEEMAHGHRVVKSFGRADHLFGGFDRRAVRLHDTAIARVRVQSSFWTFLGVIPSVTLIVVLALGALAVAQDRVTLGTLVAFTTLMMSLVWPVTSLGFLLSMTQDAMTAADRIAEIFDAENTIRDGDQDLPVVRGELAFENVSFRFPDSEHDVLHDLNLRLLPGETVALVGATGSGKTILTTLVARLWDVTGGRITLDGVDVRDLRLDRLRQVVATAFEDPVLFSMSARENIALGRPDATDADIDEAVQVAQAQFVHELPFGLDTRIGEQGMSLSGGQRQRLALARAVLAAPAVLVLDDTLSALDIHTEALVEEALQRVLAGVTGIVVAHRASTVLIADKVALLQDGTITHVGTHSELLASVPAYRELLSADEQLDDGGLEDRELEDRQLEDRGLEDTRRADAGLDDADELLEVAS
jgi:ATP-binding cassette subfamily B protein